ncbi:carboxypeptidase-like regulatory domain-containing protein [Niabella yanshanensis]|uniref:Carboxypeptidase-like regulatory domain-containing protein n=1 Tax=Niabella yanshanensis TaxID=577386 RepID=A0ABZ0WC32_9BACT|nr:carboxypeptidase-like regulatory domain-containing protein [Niabella yanshanensis]WQD40184.1 carboxypeptidase-like regulatory domain-containing protein [Niabella yanshanensis]
MIASAQNRLLGHVIDGETNMPVAGSSVFITNTSLASITNKEGYFEIPDIPAGIYKLIITHVGFETVTYDFSTEKMPPKLKVVVTPKVVAMEAVVVGGYVKETWEKWGKTFTDYFIGLSNNSMKTVIKNHKTLRFRFYKKLNKLEVVADEPIIIENKGLGYQLAYQLEHFEINFSERTNFFAGHILFTDMKGNSRQVKKWQESRREAYTGSMMHFFRSVYEGNSLDEGFEIRRVKKLRNVEKDRVRALYRHNPDQRLSDSSEYYQKILSQKDFSYEYGATLTVDSFRIVQDGQKFIYWPDYLQVVNKHKIEEQGYLDHHMERRSRYPARSLIMLQNEPALLLDANGNWYPAQGLLSEWYWGWGEKVGDLLPLNYRPSTAIVNKN